MKWINLDQLEQIDQIKMKQGLSVIFKHSTRCSISSMAKRSFEAGWDVIPKEVELYFLDLLNHRDISANIAEIFQVSHESPQMLLIKNGECILDASHGDISTDEIVEVINQ